jgi:hypothetical protein
MMDAIQKRTFRCGDRVGKLVQLLQSLRLTVRRAIFTARLCWRALTCIISYIFKIIYFNVLSWDTLRRYLETHGISGNGTAETQDELEYWARLASLNAQGGGRCFEASRAAARQANVRGIVHC